MEPHELPLSGRTVFRCGVSVGAFWLEFDGRDEISLRIEQSFQLIRDGQAVLLDREDLERLGRAAHLAGKTVTRSTVLENRDLEIDFDDGSQIIVSPDPMFEAWVLEGPGDAMVVCMPGGEVAIWE